MGGLGFCSDSSRAPHLSLCRLLAGSRHVSPAWRHSQELTLKVTGKTRVTHAAGSRGPARTATACGGETAALPLSGLQVRPTAPRPDRWCSVCPRAGFLVAEMHVAAFFLKSDT